MTSDAQRVPVLMYHRVGEAGNSWERKYCIAPDRFAAHMTALAAEGYRACAIDEFCAWARRERPLPQASFMLTFDDGFLGIYEHAMPVLESLGWPATVFLVSSLVGREDLWTRTQNPSGQTHPLLAHHHIEEMTRRRFAFHSHTRSHPDLTQLSDNRLAAELSGARRELEDLLSRPVPFLAYPYGRYDDRVIDAARAAGYESAFSVQPGFNRPGIDPYRIRRLDIFGTDSSRRLLRKVRFGSNNGSLAAAAKYYAGRVRSRFDRLDHG